MLIPLGILSSAAGVPTAVGDYELISSTILAGTATSVTFSNLGDYSATYKHLQLRMTIRTTSSQASGNYIAIKVNSDSGTNYSGHDLYGNGSTVTSSAVTNLDFVFVNRASSSVNTANTYGAFITDILDAFSTTKNKTFRNLGGNSAVNRVDFVSGVWRNTSSITSLILSSEAGNLATGSRFSLYGIRG